MALSSWIPGADGSGYPAEHLPLGVFSTAGTAPRVGARVGDAVVDLARLASDGVVDGPFAHPTLNPFLAGGPGRWRALRDRLTELVCEDRHRARVQPALVPAGAARPHLPVEVADYVDFYSSREHATNLGRLFRPDGEPLLPNWRRLPVGYHGRAGTVVVSGTPVARPAGQRRPSGGEPTFGPTAALDFELEVGFVVGAPSVPGRPVPPGAAAEHVFGVVLLNDWSARDIQAWEYQPLGPFLGKSFATTVGAWVTPLEALAACRVPPPPQDPPPLPHLRVEEPWGLALDLEVELRPAGAAAGTTVTRTSAAGLYWTLPQQVAHLTSNGAHLRTGDILATGTVSGSDRGSEGSLVELTRGGREPLDVDGARRAFLEDGDEVVLRGRVSPADGVEITLAEAAGRVVPSSGVRE